MRTTPATTDDGSAGPDWLTLAQVGERLQVTPQTVRRLVSRGELRAIKFARRIRVARADYEAFVAAKYAERHGGV
ncbi:helix-turn-helix domain-containing protein [Rhodococcus opacus]|nr:helix-turn-helix domain-containing protein [Rhodococcus opacus]